MPTAPNVTKNTTITVVETAEDIRRTMIFAQAVSGISYRTLQKESGVSLATLSQTLGGSNVVGRTSLRQITVLLRLCHALGIEVHLHSKCIPTQKLSSSPKKTTTVLTSLGMEVTQDGKIITVAKNTNHKSRY